jgi:hypothetical protein
MNLLPWTKQVKAAQQAAVREQAVTEEMQSRTSEASKAANRVILHAEMNGWTRIAKELFAS